ncbi:MAG: hypothetical protein WAN82_06580 [Candidatus Bathyarchaeia archaeon]
MGFAKSIIDALEIKQLPFLKYYCINVATVCTLWFIAAQFLIVHVKSEKLLYVMVI